MSDLHLLYVTDAYCGWCWGFAPTLSAFHARHPHLPLRLISGGLFTGEKIAPIAAYPHIPGANDRITHLTGVTFGDAYQARLQEGILVLNSDDAAAGLAALRALAPDRALEAFHAIQHAFYMEGQSLSDPRTYRAVAQTLNLDPDAAEAAFHGPQARTEAAQDYQLARTLGVDSYPTLLAQQDGQRTVLARGAATVEQVETRLQRALNPATP
ncbi:DsbA family protein [Deinococcus deserti]|uniref:Putative DsbA FrnE like protein n=1 Tax=Deinococcus deserti (strain DSM 17065 / CIP 109153 / LMG 22923 / VCD115) TaxID=546414 RepID=C1D3I7_DEIDV|nr:DsbA family protein [Deinococcus deserti]ACO48066.1 putative DsbA FrnE like protein [Deinococcus deserti VCD115]